MAGPGGDEAPDEAVSVEGGPADPEHYHQHNCGGRRGAGVRQGSPSRGPPVPGQALPHFSFSGKEHPKKRGGEEKGERKAHPSAFLTCHGGAGGLDRISLPPSPARAAPGTAAPCVSIPHHRAARLGDAPAGIQPLSTPPPLPAKSKEQELFAPLPCALGFGVFFISQLCRWKGKGGCTGGPGVPCPAIPVPCCIPMAHRDRFPLCSRPGAGGSGVTT